MKATSAIIKKKTSDKKTANSFRIVAIGASAGGLEAITELLKNLPPDTGMAFIYVQHLSPDHKSMLTEILSKSTKMKVHDIDDMEKIKPDNLFVIPHNKAIEVTDGRIKLIPRSESSAAISIDILFTSLAHAQKARVIGIILSGSASDGTRGMKSIKQEGGVTFAQDDTAKFKSMPQSAIAGGAVDFILSPKQIALELVRISKHPFVNGNGLKSGKEDPIDNSDPYLKIILNQLHKDTGVDFSLYKMTTIKRRIVRRMLLYKIKNLKEYAKLLAEKKEEISIIYQDLLINVTNFFRDTDAHKYLKTTLFPRLLKNKKPGEWLRIWVPACSTGEEAYSIAMMLLEIQDSKSVKIPVHIFATDLSEKAINKARLGLYSKQELETVSPKRIQRFFIKGNGDYRIGKAVRDMCVFAPHNILTDPPFSRLDFISCCNLFIYLDTPAQKKVVNIFHYALNSEGYLMLGKSESITSSAHLFGEFNKKFKIFTKKGYSAAQTLPVLSPRFTQQNMPEQNLPAAKEIGSSPTKKKSPVYSRNLDSAIDEVLIAEFMPASVVINHDMEIQQFRGSTGLYLTHKAGKATFNILKMARPEIAFELRNLISKAIKAKQRVRKCEIEMKVNMQLHYISIEAIPLDVEWDEPLLLILFAEQEHVEIITDNSKGGKAVSAAKDRRIRKLEEELAAARADALAFSQEQEAFAEELQSANEEVTSSNEELQTVNEELETSKEEIESTNEELITANQELQTRNDLLNESYDFSAAISSTIHEPMLILDKNLRIRSANKSFYKQFGTTEEETEGALLYELGNRQWNIPALRELLDDVIPKSSQILDFEFKQTFRVIGEKVLLISASRIIQKRHGEELLLLSITDITEVRRLSSEVADKEKKLLEERIEIINRSEAEFRQLADSMPQIVWTAQPDGYVDYYNKQWYEFTGFEERYGDESWIPILHPDDVRLRIDTYYHSIKTGEPFLLEYRFKDRKNPGGYRWFLGRAVPAKDEQGNIVKWYGTCTDIDVMKKLEERKDEFIRMASHEFKTPITTIKGYLQLLLANLKGEEEKSLPPLLIKSSLISVDKQVIRLTRLMTELLDLSRIEAGNQLELQKERFSLNELVIESVEDILYTTGTHEINIFHDFESYVFADRDRIGQVMINLLMNAIKYSPNASKIDVKIHQPKQNWVAVDIIDFGIGINKEEHKKIFDRFYRVEGKSEGTYPGFGIGLFLSADIIQKHSGEITVQSEKGKGSVFTFCLPSAS